MRCSMAVLACSADAGYVSQIVAHLKRSANYPFAETFCVVDAMGGARSGSILSAARAMRLAGEIDRFVELDGRWIGVWRKHFCRKPWRLRDNRGVPLFGWIAGIESATTEYLFHSDCDVLVHTEPDFSWVSAAIDMMDRDESVIFVAPHPGPPGDSGPVGHDPPPVIDRDGNYRLKSFSSRRYVVHRKRFERLLPLKPLHVSWRRKLAMCVGGPSSILPWETHLAAALQASSHWRVHLGDTRAWALHCPDHGETWQKNLKSIIAEVEVGRFPAPQAGHYDLCLSDWLSGGLVVPAKI